MTTRIPKAAVLDALVATLRADLASATEVQKKTVEGATHEESRPENDKDTRALESTYLARGLAQRVDDLKEALARIAPLSRAPLERDAAAAAGTIVVVEDEDGSIVRYLLVPAGGGARLEVGGERFLVVSPEAPVGMALLGRRIDDDVVLRTPKGTKDLVVVDLY